MLAVPRRMGSQESRELLPPLEVQDRSACAHSRTTTLTHVHVYPAGLIIMGVSLPDYLPVSLDYVPPTPPYYTGTRGARVSISFQEIGRLILGRGTSCRNSVTRAAARNRSGSSCIITSTIVSVHFCLRTHSVSKTREMY